jgi:hypothetical protein
MLKAISDALYRLSTGWVTLAGLTVFLLFTALVLPAQSRQTGGATGDVSSPDTSFFYSPDDLYSMAEAYGPEGRAAYVRARLTFDVVWPLVYFWFLGTALSFVFGRATSPDSPWRYANLAPLFGLIFDYLENVATSVVMARYPHPSPLFATMAPLFTATKWVFVGGSFALLVIGLILWVVRRLKER